MEPIAKNTKKKAKKASASGGRSSGRGENKLQLCLWIFWRLGETRKNSSATSRRRRRHFRQSKTTFRSKKTARQPRRKSSTISPLTLTIYPHLWRRMALWRAEALAKFFRRFPHPKPSPRSRSRRYERRLSPPQY
jgi:hypothetical protein